MVFKGTTDPGLGHAICKSSDTESDVSGGGAVLLSGGVSESLKRQVR